MAENPDIDRQDIADLRDSIRSLAVVASRLEQTLQRGIGSLLAALERVAANTEGLPAVVERVVDIISKKDQATMSHGNGISPDHE
jgi:hypothetical protein